MSATNEKNRVLTKYFDFSESATLRTSAIQLF